MNKRTNKHNHFTGRIGLLSLALTLLTGCQTAPPRAGHATMDSINDSIQPQPAAAAPTTPPPEVAAALVPPLAPQLPTSIAPVEPRFDVAIHGVEARDFFMGLVEDTPYNIIVHPDVSGTLSLDLKNVTVDEVMQAVRDVYGYEYRKAGSVYQVMPARMRSRIFKVDYINIRRLGNSRMRVSSGQVSEASTGNAGNDNGTTTTDTGTTTTKQSVSGSEINTETDSDFWSELRTALEMLIGEEDGRRVVVNPQAGVIVVRAMPGELRDVGEYLDTIQDVVQRQVVLEAKIIEVQLSDGFQSGINWMAIGRPAKGETIQIGQTGGGSVFEDGVASSSGSTINLVPGVAQNGLTSKAFGGVFTLGVSANDFVALIELLETQGNVQVLSSPRVATVNNQKAVIKVGTDEFFVTDIDTETNTTGTSTLNQNVSVELTPFFSGVALDVIPQIDDNGDVILHIHPTVSEVKEKTKQINVSTSTTLSVPLALSSIRESDAVIRAKSGQIVVIGGLMKDQLTENEAKTPVLGDLPLMGSLFQHKKQSKTKSELVILLRPVVTDGVDTWQDQLRQSAERIRQLHSGSNPMARQ